MLQTAETPPSDDPVAAFLLEVMADGIAGVLVPDLQRQTPGRQVLAHQAALRLIAAQAPAEEAELLRCAQTVAFGIAALRAVGMAMGAERTVEESRRLLTCAAALHRAEARLRTPRPVRGVPARAAAAVSQTDPLASTAPTPSRPVGPAADPAIVPPAQAAPPAPPQPGSQPAARLAAVPDFDGIDLAALPPLPDPADWPNRAAWAAAAADAAQRALLQAAPPRSPRRHALASAAMPPVASPMASRATPR